jgi:hypothetical protein
VTKVEEQIVLLRTEMRGECSAIRRAMATEFARYATKEDLKAFATKENLIGLKSEMHVLYEYLAERIKLLGESWSRSKRTSRKKKP